jgi:4-amino-4-deoxy-L-arabinose transferase-like glycosyltransferase
MTVSPNPKPAFAWPSSLASLWGLLALIYLPFLGLRGIRMAGDEKVYISQALEMEKAGTWFVQTLNGAPDYYKGPFHFLAVRFGFMIFGHSLWAGLFMNLIFIAIGTWAIYSILKPEKEHSTETAFWGAGLFGLSLGIYTHSFASQMEVELAGTFALGLYFLNKSSRSRKAEVWFWIIAGFAGWIKSPLHSVFLGSAGLLFWLLNGELLSRLKSLKSWGAVLLGVGVGIVGYLPAATFDYANFLERYLLKETYNKSSSGQGVLVTLTSTFGFYLFPGLVIALTAYLKTFTLLRFWKNLSPSSQRTFKLCISLILPSVLFFSYHPYRFENYNLPVIAAPIIWLATTRFYENRFWDNIERTGFALLALVLAILAGGVLILQIAFHPDSSWWPSYLGWSCAAGTLGTAFCFIRFGVLPQKIQLVPLTYSCLGLYLSIGLLSSTVGEKEMRDLRNFLAEKPDSVLTYYNREKNIWNEWGILNLVFDRPVQSLYNNELISDALKSKKVILVPSPEFLQELTDYQKAYHPELALEVKPWKRWRTRGMGTDGQPLWRQAWNTKDLSVLERNFYIVQSL